MIRLFLTLNGEWNRHFSTSSREKKVCTATAGLHRVLACINPQLCPRIYIPCILPLHQHATNATNAPPTVNPRWTARLQKKGPEVCTILYMPSSSGPSLLHFAFTHSELGQWRRHRSSFRASIAKTNAACGTRCGCCRPTLLYWMIQTLLETYDNNTLQWYIQA